MAPKTFEALTPQEREARKKLIAKVARELFARNAFGEVTIRKIAQATGQIPGCPHMRFSRL